MRKKRNVFKKLCFWCGATFLAFLLILVGFGIWLAPEKLDFDSPYHPFKTEQAKIEYLKLYDERARKWPVTSTTKMVKTSYGKTFVRISGPEDSDPLVLMHGVGGNSLQWMPNVASLSEHYRIFAIDNVWDNGRSIPSRYITNADDYVHWLNELFDALGLQKSINMVGLSYGGWITTQYALKYPHRLNKVVLLAPVGTVAQLSPEWVLRAFSVLIPFKCFSQNFVYWLAEDTLNSGAEGRALIEEHVTEMFMAISSFMLKEMVNPIVLTDEELQNLQMPILFVVGENEKVYSPTEVLERLNTVAPHIQTELIMRAGHDLTMAQADIVNNCILDFLRQPIDMQ